MYIVGEKTNNGYFLVIVDISLKQISFIDPFFDRSVIMTQPAIDLMVHTETALNSFLDSKLPTVKNINWKCVLNANQHYQYLQNDFDSAMYIITILYFVVLDCPIVFKQGDMSKFRTNFAYYILNDGCLPY